MMVWTRIVAPTNVHAHHLGGDVGNGLVHHAHVSLRRFLKVSETGISEASMPTHRKVGTVHLQAEAGGVYCVVLALHRLAQGLDVLGMIWKG